MQQQFDIWQEWNNYLIHRSEEFQQSITQLCIDNQTRLYNLIQEEIHRGIYEWNALHFQKMMTDWNNNWGNMFAMPTICLPSHR